MADEFDIKGDSKTWNDESVVDLLDQYIAAGFDTTSPSGTANQEFRTVRAYLQQIYGPLPEGADDYAASDLDGDNINEVYAVDANGKPHTVYSYDDNNEVESTSYDDWASENIESGEEQDPRLLEAIQTYGQNAVDDGLAKIKELETIIGKAVDDPFGTLEGIITSTSSGTSSCQAAGPGDWWLDCVTVGVTLPFPLPLPGPLGGIFKGATVRDVVETVQSAGHEIGKVLRGETSVEEVLDDLGDWIGEKVQGVLGDDEKGTITIESVLGAIGGFLPNVAAGVIWSTFQNQIENKIGLPILLTTEDGTEDSRCRDAEGNLTPWGERNPASCGQPVTFEESDLFGTGGLDSTVECDQGTNIKGNCICPDGQPEDKDGKCASTTVDTGDTVDTERDPRCSNPAFAERNLSLCGGSTTFTEGPGFGQVDDDDCPEGTVVTSENAEVCGKTDCGGGVFVDKGEECPTTENPDDLKCPEGTIITSENAEECGYKECNGAYIPKDQVCPPTVNPCINGEEPDPQKGCPEDWCDDAMTIAPDENGQCPSDPPLVKCPDGPDKGKMVTSLDECGTSPALVKCPDGPDKGKMVTSLDECGTTTPTYTCPDPNATTREDGSCGPCKTGYVYDGAVERCVQSTTPDPCLDSAYAAANPTECGTATECNDCTCAEYAAANPEECATGSDTPSGGGGGGGGGGSTGSSGMFEMTPTDITAAPELLTASRFPIENFLRQYIDGPDNQDISITGLFEGLV